ncbi:alpha/beta hydrolase [Ferruginibacter paludis]|uniref:alpha/beta hydrolase n=1 Tax=Ferruginibacter paludis TaxID=1310417 RepID=UPI0025B5BF2B|nr:alpha/beta hydrolase [Ferruginibacter paludis]MDN3654249.1 alpha/beta hydrolase [Ferruginibacter paludis]
MRIKILFFISLVLSAARLLAQTVIPLYTGAIPNSVPNNMKEITINWDGHFGGYKSIATPTLEVYLPAAASANGSAVIICPGGGYGMESYQAEGINIANAFIKQGTAAFILKYRLPSDSIMKDKSIGPLQDAQQAIKQVRENAVNWHIEANKIGIMGFSAGGHLAASAAVHFDSAFIPNKEHTSLRPDFMVLVYPVISMTDQLTHAGSRQNLLGENIPLEKINFFSNEKNVTDKTPPAWITHSEEDKVVDVDNSILFYEALRHHHVPVEMHLYPKGNHGFVLSQPTEQWMRPLFDWMKTNGWMK